MEKRSAKVAENKPAQKTKAEASNEETKKKIIKLSEVAASNLDPLAFFFRFPHLQEMFLELLSGRDLIKFSEASPFCYNFIAASKDLMEKIKIVFIGELHQEDYDLLKNSSRLYQNIEVRRNVVQPIRNGFNEFGYISTSELDFFLSKARDWKNVLINETYFKRKLDLVNFLSSIESSIESFSVINTKPSAFPFDKDSTFNFESFDALAFLKLKHLKMHFFEHLLGPVSDVYYKFFVNSAALEKFEYEAYFSIHYGSALMKMLENSDKLTSLSLKTFMDSIFRCDSWKRFQFQLKNLVFHSGYTCDDIQVHFRDFLKSQSDLESLSLDVPHCEEIFPEIMKLTKLRTLALKDFKVNSNDDVPNKLSNTITHLKVRYLVSPLRLINRRNRRYLVDPVSLKFMLMSMPNIKSLHFYEINEEIFQVLLEIKTKFVELKVVCLNGVEEEDLKILLINENDKCLVESFD